jgi:hypothetical protein
VSTSSVGPAFRSAMSSFRGTSAGQHSSIQTQQRHGSKSGSKKG